VGGRFEDVGLGEGDGDEGADEGGRREGVGAGGLVGPVPVKKRGFFAKFEFGGGDGNGNAGNGNGNGNGGVEEESGTVMSRFLPLGGGRKRAQSGGQGAELGVMDLPAKAQGVEA
jgi:hypothetical protein